ncbi:MAG: HAD family hydrolase [Geobacteraceae bacterium]|nr:HAD family hydrolase [Geobacteraceae bacterium]
MNRVTSIIFDLDGTLYVSDVLAAEIQTVAADGMSLQLDLPVAEAKSRLSAAKEQLLTATGCEATLSAACELLGCDLKLLHKFLAENVKPENHLRPDDRVTAMLKRLSGDYGLYIYTNNNRILTDRIISLIGLDGLFAEIFSVEDFWRSKPDRLALAKIYAAIGAEPVECLFVGDRYDVDLTLPEEHGSRVYLTTSITELLSMEELLKKGE